MAVKREQARRELVGAAEGAIDDLQAWCDAHPGYRLSELEEQVRVIRRRLMGEVMSSLVAERPAMEGAGEVVCAKCLGRMEDKGEQIRTVAGPEGPVRLSRRYYYCPSCREGFFPPGPGIGLDQAALD
jgi:hypothetical protein